MNAGSSWGSSSMMGVDMDAAVVGPGQLHTHIACATNWAVHGKYDTVKTPGMGNYKEPRF